MTSWAMTRMMVCHAAISLPCIRGMRIRVKDVLDMLAGSAPQEEILSDFPDLPMEDIRACIAAPNLR
jgi:uncharacterized protein (DUF433 family)